MVKSGTQCRQGTGGMEGGVRKRWMLGKERIPVQERALARTLLCLSF